MDSEKSSSNEPFLLHLATHLTTEYGPNLSKVKVVLPNQRASLFLKSFLAKKIQQPIWAPAIQSIEEFMVEVSGLEIVNTVDLLFEFYTVYKQTSNEPESFDSFCEWAPILLNDFDEIDRQLADTEELFTYINEAYAIKVWNTENKQLTEFQKNYLRFWASLKSYYFQLKKHLQRDNCGWQGLVFRTAFEKISTGNFTINEKMVFAGFNALTKAEEEIFKVLYNNSQAELLWDADSYYLNNSIQEAGKFLRRHISTFGKKSFKWEFDSLNSERKNITTYGASGSVQQCKVAGKLLKKIPEEEYKNTAIVLADEELLLPLLTSLPKQVDKVNITMGYPLKLTPIHSLICLLIDLFERKKKSNNNFYYKDIIGVLRHPYSTDSSDSNVLFNQIFSKNLVYVPHGLLNTIENKEHNKVIELLQKDVKHANILCEAIIELVKHLGKKFSTQKFEYECLFAYHNTLLKVSSYLKQLDEAPNFITLKLLINRIVANESVDFYGEPLEGLQVMGMLETRNLDFSNVILLSTNEDILPKIKSSGSFIPFEMQQHFGILSKYDKNAVFAYHFYRLLQRADNTHLIYSTETEYMKSGEKSRFITQIQRELDKASIKNRIITAPLSNEEEKVISIEKNKSILEKVSQVLSQGVSASALNTFINCPLDFYYKYVVGVKQQESVEESVEASTMGNAVHFILEQLYKPFEGEEIAKQHMTKMLPEIGSLALEFFTKEYGKVGITSGRNLLSMRVAEKMVSNFLSKEMSFIDQQGPIYLVACEKEMIASLNNNESKIKLKGTIDRIDKVGDRIRIIDYKTGNVEGKYLKLDTEKAISDYNYGKAVQLLVYKYLYMSNFPDKHSGEIWPGIISLKQVNKGEMNLQENENWDIENISTFLHTLIDDIKKASVPFLHNTEAKYCIACPEN